MRSLFFAVLLLVSPVSFAENWQLVEDSVSGDRVIVDVDSVTVDNYTKIDKTTGVRILANMQIISSNPEKNSDVFVTIIDAEDCLQKNAGTIVNVFSPTEKIVYFWSAQGTLMYDAQGQWLCSFLKIAISKQPKQNEKPKINM